MESCTERHWKEQEVSSGAWPELGNPVELRQSSCRSIYEEEEERGWLGEAEPKARRVDAGGWIPGVGVAGREACVSRAPLAASLSGGLQGAEPKPRGLSWRGVP
ncbi:hypothetical protein KIL84_010358 [Mauremys mutica]|uniref:Uncharacterized protein n=1 Tax=Mauremys mutica TaxID=74926 RepID=A0A9D4B1B5_9SAUR|nr:hypothetical protein KIL84_010358 [Mauremys mutica]